jgi:hypothetical protein
VGTGEAHNGGDNGGTVVAMRWLGEDGGVWVHGHSVRGTNRFQTSLVSE